MTLAAGVKAPAFQAADQDGAIHELEEYTGQWLLLYFYPKDDTPGCTIEACGFRDALADLEKELQVVGVSADSVESHKQFAEKYSLTFTLLADPERKIITAYQVGSLFAKRVSFLIDPQGVIVKVYDRVEPKEHAAEILKDVRQLKK